MVGKLTTVLIKKEAESYIDQGLHQEAIDLYDRLLSSSPSIDPAIRAAIHSQIEEISEALRMKDAEKGRPLLTSEIVRIRDGWGDKATESDTLVCAQAFIQVGAYGEALEEFKKLGKTVRLKKIHIQAVADCLVQLHTPQALAPPIHHLCMELTENPKTALAVQITMAKHMAGRQHSDHALALCRAMVQRASLKPAIRDYITDLAADIASQPSAPTADPNPVQRIGRFRARFSLTRLLDIFRKEKHVV